MDDTVGECFPDRTDFVVRAVRDLPKVVEATPTRFTSLAPDSSARPRKRDLNHLLQRATEYNHPSDDYGSTNKRQRLYGNVSTETGAIDQPFSSIERDVEVHAQSSSRRAENQDDYVVADSQPSPPANRKLYLNILFDWLIT